MILTLRKPRIENLVDLPTSLPDTFTMRVHSTDGRHMVPKQSAMALPVRPVKIQIDLQDALRIPAYDIRVFREVVSAMDRTSASTQQIMIKASTWTHGFGIPELLMSYKFVSGLTSWVPLGAPVLSMLLAKAFTGILSKTPLFGCRPGQKCNTLFPPGSPRRSQWKLILGGTAKTTYVLLGIEKEPEEVDLFDSSEAFKAFKAGCHPADRAVFPHYDIAMVYVSGKTFSCKMLDHALVCPDPSEPFRDGGLHPVRSKAEGEFVDAALDAVRGSLILSGLVNAYLLELENIDCIHATRLAHRCEMCNCEYVDSSRPAVCQGCMQHVCCEECTKSPAFELYHNKLVCEHQVWSFEVPLDLPCGY